MNVTFKESLPPSKTSPFIDDDLVESQVIESQENLDNDKEDELLNKEIVNIKESKSHPLDSVIGKINERTLRSKIENQSNFFCFVSTIESKNINEAIKKWIMVHSYARRITPIC